MGKKRLYRELKPTEIPEDADESLTEAVTVRRRPHNSKAVAAGAEHRAGDEQEEQTRPSEETLPRDDPPRGRKPSGG